MKTENEVLKETILDLREQRDQFLTERNRSRQMAQEFYEFFVRARRGPTPYPSALIKRYEQTLGLHGYKFPIGHER